ncbi:BTB/POZ domain-containing protein At1g50280-like [Abrus precatorius]|uniref:BTB/POZ domain-containing protein At1g50280-like n=1 Tax=Abrus precatorius TaxID=3816 RepID=A0A8B8M5N5_ABRPR|nr:BTB/POZ domain-containing protein At1g50280-like [Abrus precatorius]
MKHPLPYNNNEAPWQRRLEVAMLQHCDLQIHINDEETFLLDKKFISKYCGRIKKILNHEKRECHDKNLSIEINDFPGGPYGFELVSRFCYNHGQIPITVSNVLNIHCCALYLGMTEEFFSNNLLQQTETFLEGIYYWTWNEVLESLKSCDLFYTYVDSYGLLEKIICALLAKMAQNSDVNLFTSSSSSSPSSPESNFAKRFSYSTQVTPKIIESTLPSKAWWFEDLASLPPKIIEKFLQCIGAYRTDNNNFVLTRFLLHYLRKVTLASEVNCKSSIEYSGLAESAAYGVIFIGNKTFSCKSLFWVLWIVSRFGMSRDCRYEIEKLIGGVFEQATLDDLLVSGHHLGLYYDVTFVIRLIKQFVNMNDTDGVSVQKLKKVGRLIDKYLAEISPDQNLKISKFRAVAECLPDCARDCFDGVYKAIGIYLQSHAMLAFEERSRLCGCLNYNKLSFEACKDLAKNPRIPPRIAMQALISQQTKIPLSDLAYDGSEIMNPSQISLYYDNTDSFLQEKEDMKINLKRMQMRVRELEKLCKEMKVQMPRFH